MICPFIYTSLLGISPSIIFTLSYCYLAFNAITVIAGSCWKVWRDKVYSNSCRIVKQTCASDYSVTPAVVITDSLTTLHQYSVKCKVSVTDVYNTKNVLKQHLLPKLFSQQPISQ